MSNYILTIHQRIVFHRNDDRTELRFLVYSLNSRISDYPSLYNGILLEDNPHPEAVSPVLLSPFLTSNYLVDGYSPFPTSKAEFSFSQFCINKLYGIDSYNSPKLSMSPFLIMLHVQGTFLIFLFLLTNRN